MKWKHVALLLLCIGLAGHRAQAQARFPVNVEQFAKQANQVTTVSLNKNMLQFAAQFMSSGKQNQAARNIINHLDGIYVRVYDFKRPASYSTAAVEVLRKHFRGPEWSQIVSTRSKGPGDNTDIYVRTVGGQVQGMFLISAQPNELAFVNIIGPIRPEDLKVLSGHFGLPAMGEKKGGGKDGSRKEVKKNPKQGGER